MPGNVSSLASNGDRTVTASWRAARRGAAILLAVAVVASGCGGDPVADEDAGGDARFAARNGVRAARTGF